MKMNLSVVMQTIDKMSAPLKKITSTQSKYSKEIAQVKAQSDKLASSQALIGLYRKTAKETAKTTDKFNAAQQKLGKLNEKMKSAKKPSEALQLQMKKQQEIVKNLKKTQSGYIKALSKTQSRMKTAGINVKRLSVEEKRLSKEYEQRIAIMGKLAKKEERLQRIRARLARFKLPSIGGAAMAKGGALLGGLSFAGLFAGVNSSAAEMDKLSKAAQNLDMPVEELQAMQSQAEHAGVSADTMTSAMTRFTKRLGVLQTTGKGALGSFLDKGENPLYGVLKTAGDTEQAYGQVLNAFSKLKTNQEQMAFADATFGQDGRKMLIMLREGTTGLSSARKEFNDLGGGVKTADAKKAEAYNDAMQKIKESFRSIKFAALAPIMEKLTVIFTEFSNKFKNAQWRTEVIEKVKKVVISLFNGFKALSKGLYFLSQNIPEVIAGLILFKIAMFALNAAMFVNPVGLIVAGIAALAVGIIYLMNKTGVLMPVLNGLWAVFKRIGAGIGAIIGAIIQNFLLIPRAIIKAISLIPDSLLPNGWGESIKLAQKDLEGFNKSIEEFGNQSINYAVNGEFKETHNKLETVRQKIKASQSDKQGDQSTSSSGSAPIKQAGGYGGMLRHPTVQSKAQVDVRIKSDKPVEIVKAESDKYTEMKVDTFDLLGMGF
jgi:hypothetical protein